MSMLNYQDDDGWIETYTGIQFNFMNPTKNMFSVIDVAHSLAMQCRYNGHTKRHYSVAEHCVLMARWFKANGYDAVMCLTALMHDAAETYISDLPRPVKNKVPEFKAIEMVIDKAAAEVFGTYYPFPKIIKEADSRILRDERLVVMNDSGHSWNTDTLETMDIVPQMWDSTTAEAQFLDCYFELVDEINARELV